MYQQDQYQNPQQNQQQNPYIQNNQYPNLNNNYQPVINNDQYQPNPYPQNQYIPQGQPMFMNQMPYVQQAVPLEQKQVSAEFNCSSCKFHGKTETKYIVGSTAWIFCLLLFCFFPFVSFLPFCIDSCKDVEHKCPQCKQVQGIFRRNPC